MLNTFKRQVEMNLGYEINHSELTRAIEATKDDAFMMIVMDRPVTPEYFNQKICEYIICIRRSVQ